ncbi:MAG: LppU/SCO3897 family protein [Micromonosporaceae bacterium]
MEPAAPKKSKAPLIIGIIVAIVLVCCGGGTLAIYLAGDAAKKAAEEGNTGGGTEDDGSDIPSTIDDVQAGDCITMEGTDDAPDAKPAECNAKGAYEVLLRKDGTLDEKVCEKTDYTEVFMSDVIGETSTDYILCVKPVK